MKQLLPATQSALIQTYGMLALEDVSYQGCLTCCKKSAFQQANGTTQACLVAVTPHLFPQLTQDKAQLEPRSVVKD